VQATRRKEGSMKRMMLSKWIKSRLIHALSPQCLLLLSEALTENILVSVTLLEREREPPLARFSVYSSVEIKVEGE